jgi:hypothetical protein
LSLFPVYLICGLRQVRDSVIIPMGRKTVGMDVESHRAMPRFARAKGMVQKLGNTLQRRAAMNRSATKQRRINPAFLHHIKLHLWSAAM